MAQAADRCFVLRIGYALFAILQYLSLFFPLLLVTFCISTVLPVLNLVFLWLLPVSDLLVLESILSTSLDFVGFLLLFIENRR